MLCGSTPLPGLLYMYSGHTQLSHPSSKTPMVVVGFQTVTGYDEPTITESGIIRLFLLECYCDVIVYCCSDTINAPCEYILNTMQCLTGQILT